MCHTDRYPNLIKILAVGDSWFAYPRKFFLFGDEIVDMASGNQKFSLLKALNHIPFNILLLSWGGNNIVGRYDF
jgi:hypothetical protein